MKNSFIYKTDSYKVTHFPQYPNGTTKIYSYLESRGGKFPETLFFGLQFLLKKHFEGVRIKQSDIDDAEKLFFAHFGRSLFNRKGWEYIVNELGGILPLHIKAVKEGTVIPIHNVLMTIENTDPNCYWLTNYAETLLSHMWYPITVATNSFMCKRIINKYLLETQGSSESLPFKLHDFGYRGVSSEETASVGGMAHLVNFMGTDNIAGIICAMEYYGSDVCGFSIPASEHSTMTSWGKENELSAYKNMFAQYPEGMFACVIDSYDAYNAVEKLYGEILHEDVINRNGVIVLRPDSGDPVEITGKIISILWDKFGGDLSPKGFKVLNSHIRMIQGDGIDIDSIEKILYNFKHLGFSAENIAFGSGGGLLQKFDRDTNKFAIKCSYAEINGKGVDVFKDPITSKDKSSKKGILKLQRGASHFHTISSSNKGDDFYSYHDDMQTVFLNGELMNEQNFSDIKLLSNSYL